jgi:hypothetical protein
MTIFVKVLTIPGLRLKQFLLIVAFSIFLQSSALALQLPEQPYHDWTVAVGDYPYGLLVTSVSTYVFVGAIQLELTHSTAMIVVGLFLAVAGSYVVWNLFRRGRVTHDRFD